MKHEKNQDNHSKIAPPERDAVPGEETSDECLEMNLRLTAIADAQADLLRHLCRLVAESWRKSHLESQSAHEIKTEAKEGSPN